MQTEYAQKAQGAIRTGAPTGFRRLSPNLLAADRLAENFAGLPDGVSVPGQVLAAFKSGAPRLGLPPRLVHAVDWLFKFTQPQDWGRGGHPIVWPSASMQQEALGLSPSQVKATNRALIAAGLITMKDSPNGKRYGKRDPDKRIVEAYGFDLAPLAARYAEFMRLAAEARAERAHMGRLRRRATIARNGITQILETAAEFGLAGEEWAQLDRESRDLVRAVKRVELPAEMELGVENLERRQKTAKERLETLLAQLVPAADLSVDSTPKGTENSPHQYTYKRTPYPEQDTVIVSKECKSGGLSETKPETPSLPQEPKGAKREIIGRPARTDAGTVAKLSIDELLMLAPRLRSFLRTPDPAWPDIVNAADWLRGELGVSKSLWSEACQAMGRETAAIAIAIVSAKPPEHFKTTPGGYFFGMVAKAKAGELNLARTIWGLRQNSGRKAAGDYAGTGLA